MIIKKPSDITASVLKELEGAQDARFKEILHSAVKHLHAFVSETKLSEPEYQKICGIIARMGQMTNEHHNEVVLAGGSLGISALVCLLNNGMSAKEIDNNHGATGVDDELITTANMLGPFWRDNSPLSQNGDNLARGTTKGDPIFVKAWVRDRSGEPVPNATVDVWHTSAEGFYENQDPSQVDMNMRGRFKTNALGLIEFRSVKPAGYPIPVNGPVGDLLRMQGRTTCALPTFTFSSTKGAIKLSSLRSTQMTTPTSTLTFNSASLSRYWLTTLNTVPMPRILMLKGIGTRLNTLLLSVRGNQAIRVRPSRERTQGNYPSR